jgi:drug/metabolite transporter (DMT)-like permease
MSSQHSAYFLALTAAVLFSGASVIFARFAVSHSSLWINFMKNSVACVAFCAVAAFSVLFAGEKLSDIGSSSYVLLLSSGILGLGIGDYFLFRGYQRIGSARAIMVFSFSPLFLALGGFLFFGQGLSWGQGAALFLMMACVWTISYEKFKSDGHWEWKGILFAVIGVSLDNAGVLLTREAFDRSPGMSAYTANAVRAIGSVVLIWILLKLAKERSLSRFKQLSFGDRNLVLLSGLMGTFLSLTCWLTALKIGHIASLAAVGSFNPVAASLWEWALLRKRPTPYLIVAMGLFLTGFFLLLFWT